MMSIQTDRIRKIFRPCHVSKPLLRQHNSFISKKTTKTNSCQPKICNSTDSEFYDWETPLRDKILSILKMKAQSLLKISKIKYFILSSQHPQSKFEIADLNCKKDPCGRKSERSFVENISSLVFYSSLEIFIKLKFIIAV